MINKKKALFLFDMYGDAVVDFVGRTAASSIVCTTDFNNKYIKSIKRSKRFSLKGNILVFDWTNNEFSALAVKDIKSITALSTILGNKKDG